MKQKLFALSQRYGTALRKHLKQGPRAVPPGAAALRLGRQAAALGLETLELARMHERALVTLEASSRKNERIKRAEIFFAEAITPIVEAQRAAREGKTDFKGLKRTLARRTLELAAAHRQLQRGLVRRKSGEAALRKSGEDYPSLLQESLHRQEGLRELTHRNFSAQEGERTVISHQLQNEIAQTLLSINVRLLNLRTAARGDRTNLIKEIASAQRLVEESVRSINRYAHELDVHQPASRAADPGAMKGRPPRRGTR